jgi:hypothetical protein
VETKVTEAPLNADTPLIATGGWYTGRERIAEWIRLRAIEPGISNKEVARRFGLAPHSLNALITKATKEGWLIFEDSLSRLEYEIIPKVTDNLNYFLDKKDKTVTIETAKGTLFKQYQESKGISDAPQTILALKIEPADDDTVKVITGQIIGRGREIE